jgi:hypothetical protein
MGDSLTSSVIDLLVAMTIFRDEFDGRFIVLAVALVFLQCFHWALRLRVDYVEQTTQFSRLDLWRLALLASLLLLADVGFVWYALVNVLDSGVGVIILFGFEATLLACAVIQSSLRLVYNVYDMKTNYHWRAKGFFVLWTDFVAECFNVLVYLIFFGVVLVYVGRPLHLIRQMYYTFRRFLDFVRDISLWRRATVNFDDRYPNVTQAELLEQNSDDVCIICREQIDVGKRLPCGHVLHAECLQDWLRRKQICPTCRVSVLREEIRDTSKLWKPPRERARAAAAAAAAPPAAPAPAAAAVIDDEDDDDDEHVPAPLQRNHQVDEDDDDDNDAPQPRAAAVVPEEPRARARRPRVSRRKKESEARVAISLLLEAASDAALDTPRSRQQAIKRAQKAIQLLDDNGGDATERNLEADQWREVDRVMEETARSFAEMTSSMRKIHAQLRKDHKRLSRSIAGEPESAAAAESSSGPDESALLEMAMLASLEDAPSPKVQTAASTTTATTTAAATTAKAPAASPAKFSLPDALTSPPATPVPAAAASTTNSRSPLTASTPTESSLTMSGTFSELSASTSSMTTPSEREEMRQKRLARLGSLQFANRSPSEKQEQGESED